MEDSGVFLTLLGAAVLLIWGFLLRLSGSHRWATLLIVAGMTVLAANAAIEVFDEDYGMCIEGGEPPHCAGPGGPRELRR